MTTPEEPDQPTQPPAYGGPGGAQEGGQYGAPQYGQPQYGQPPYGQEQYGQPAYGQPPYGQGSYGQPAYGAAAGGYQLANWLYRVGGYIIDAIIVLVPSAIIGLLTGSRAVYEVLSFVGLYVVLGYLNGAQGQTPGKRVVGVRLVRERDGQLLGAGMGIVRQICHILDSLACLLGWLWPLWD